ncbi:MAG: division/cell wall cluster transcriptional repressor MraZ [Erysipelotrichales bacterium]|nr:MAG: division/cell wall cluster transcriptional repressor MraZ [Erysipelotrichales bacterium]
MFMGEYRHNLDAKGRIIIPARFRDELGPVIILTRGLDGCIAVYTQTQWEQVLNQLSSLPSTKREARQYVHFMTAKAAECEIDGQGRVLIPLSLAQEVKIEKECVVLGINDHVEIWSKPLWDSYYNAASVSIEDVAESLTEFLR